MSLSIFKIVEVCATKFTAGKCFVGIPKVLQTEFACLPTEKTAQLNDRSAWSSAHM